MTCFTGSYSSTGMQSAEWMTKGQAAFIGDEPVHVVIPLPIQPLARIGGGRNADIVLMHLMGDDHAVDIRTDGGTEAPEIFPDAGGSSPD